VNLIKAGDKPLVSYTNPLFILLLSKKAIRNSITNATHKELLPNLGYVLLVLELILDYYYYG
jgi:hypothetical protein